MDTAGAGPRAVVCPALTPNPTAKFFSKGNMGGDSLFVCLRETASGWWMRRGEEPPQLRLRAGYTRRMLTLSSRHSHVLGNQIPCWGQRIPSSSRRQELKGAHILREPREKTRTGLLRSSHSLLSCPGRLAQSNLCSRGEGAAWPVHILERRGSCGRRAETALLQPSDGAGCINGPATSWRLSSHQCEVHTWG